MADRVDVLIDGDPLVYRVGFSLERRQYILQWRTVDPAHPDDRRFDTEHFARADYAWRRDALIELLNIHPDEYAEDLISIPEQNPVIVFGRVKAMIKDIKNNVGAYLYEHGQEIGEVKIFLSGSTNFRNAVAEIQGYKHSRDVSKRPHWYSEIREYLIKHHGAFVTDGIEADDELAIQQWNAEEGSTIICTIDKDLQNVKGHFYNYLKKEAYFITYDQARLHFWRQMLTGDATDDIPGLHRVGKKGAEKVFPEYTNEQDMWLKVLAQYITNMEKFPEHHAPHTDARDSARENGRLLHMMTHRDELWTPPDEDDVSLAEWCEENVMEDPDEELASDE